MVSPAVTAAIVGAFVSAVLGGIVSYLVSSSVAKEQVHTQMELENDQRIREWYERSIALVQRTSDDWWDVMASGEKDFDIDAESTLLNRRDEIREHAAKGRGLGVDDEIVTDLHRAADSLNHAVSELDSGKQLAKIEKETLLPTLDNIEEECQQKDGVSE